MNRSKGISGPRVWASLLVLMGMFWCFPHVTLALQPGLTPTNAGLDPKSLLQQFRRHQSAPDQVNPVRSGEILVQFRGSRLNLQTGAGQRRMGQFAQRHWLKVGRVVASANLVSFTYTAPIPIASLGWRLKQDMDVELVQANYQYQPLTNDTLFNDLWALYNIGQTVNGVTGTFDADIDATAAWNIFDGTDITVAVIDTGVAYNHPDLINQMWDGSLCVDANNQALGGCVNGYDVEHNDLDPLPTLSSHGSHVAGIIAAEKDNNLGIAGVAPNAKIMALKTQLTTVEIVQAIRFADYNGADIINASWGGTVNDPIMKSAISGFSGLFIAAAGNDGVDHQGSPLYPCDYTWSNIICVTASDQFDHRPDWADYGYPEVDLAAPGSNIESIIADRDFLEEDFTGVADGDLPPGYTASDPPNDFGVLDEIFIAGDASNTPYAQTADATVTSPSIDLSEAGSAWMFFLTACDTEYGDDWSDYMALGFTNAPVYAAQTFDSTWGASGSGNGEFNDPQDIAIGPDGSVYVADSDNDRIQKFLANGAFDSAWGSTGSGNGQFNNPSGLAVDQNGNIYVADTGNDRIQKFNAALEYVSQFGTTGANPGELSGPWDVAVDAAGSIYVAEGDNHRVQKFKSNFSWVWETDGFGTGPGQFNGPHGIAVNHNGFLVVSDLGNDRIQYLTEDGDWIGAVGWTGTDQRTFGQPQGIAFDADGNVYVADTGNDRIQVLGTGLQYLTAWGATGSGNGEFNAATAVAVAPNGDAYAVDHLLNRVQKFSYQAPTTPAGPSEFIRWNERSIDLDDDPDTASLAFGFIPIPTSSLTNDFQFQYHWVADGDGLTGTTGMGCWITSSFIFGFSDGADEQYDFYDGTSMAAPHVAGAAAVVWTYKPSLTRSQVKSVLLNSGDSRSNFQNRTVSGRRLNLYKALRYFAKASLSNTPSSPTKSTSASITVGGFDTVNYKYKLDGGGWSTSRAVGTPISLSNLANGNHTLSVIGQDSIGTWQPTGEATTYTWKVDTVKPTANITYSIKKMTDRSVVATLVPSETVTVTNNGGSKTKTFTANGSFTFTFRDAAGNTNSKTATVNNIITPMIVVGAGPGSVPVVRTANGRTGEVWREWKVFDSANRAGVNVATGDVNGDRRPEIIVGTGRGSDPMVRVYSQTGTHLLTFDPYPASNGIGAAVASGDVNGDGIDEILTVPAGGAAHVRVFRFLKSPNRVTELASVMAYDSSAKNGFEIAAGDVNKDGRDEFAVTANTQGQTVSVFRWKSGSVFERLGKFSPYGRVFDTGLRIGIGDATGDGKAEIYTTPGPGYWSDVKAFSASGSFFKNFLAADKSYLGGFTLAAVDTNKDKKEDILTATYGRIIPYVGIHPYNSTYGYLYPRNYSIFQSTMQNGQRIDAVPHP